MTMNEAYLALGIDKICKVWHSLKYTAEKFGYKQLFIDKFNCETMDNWNNIKDLDYINNPNMTRVNWFHERNRKLHEEKQRKKQEYRRNEENRIIRSRNFKQP